MTTAELDRVEAAARSGDRRALRDAVRRLRLRTESRAMRTGYSLAMRSVAERVRRQVTETGVGPSPADLLPWLDQEARLA